MIDLRDRMVPDTRTTHPISTLCEVCAKACGGCRWSEKGVQQPVPGWDAVRRDYRDYSGNSVESYVVLDCPEFALEAHRAEEYRRFDRGRARWLAMRKNGAIL